MPKIFHVAMFFFMIVVGVVGCGSDNNYSENIAPVANAGVDQNVTTGTLVTIDGSLSRDADGDLLTYAWSFSAKPPGSSTVLSSNSTVRPTFAADVEGEYTLSLVVNDGNIDSSAATVTIVATTGNSTPIANAGPDQNVVTGDLVILDGKASNDADGDLLSYNWSITSMPAGSSASLSNANSEIATFTSDIDGNYVLTLIVNDGTSDSSVSTITVVAATANSAPVADAGPDQSVDTGSLVALDASASSDANNDSLTYLWSFISVPAGSLATLSDPNDSTPTFTVDLPGDYVLGLIVNDGHVDSAQDSVTITSFTTPLGTSNLPQTGQTVCYEIPFSGTTVPCAGTGQDGETRAGVAWPSPRFTSVSPEIARDELTGLEWTKDRNAPGPAECVPNLSKTWQDALDYIKCINQNSYLGHSDWYLPNVVQLSSILNADLDPSFSGQFILGSLGYWWSSTTRENDKTKAYTSVAEDGYISYSIKSELLKVWPVRNAEPGLLTLPQTGQTQCYDSLAVTINCSGTGQDGDVLAGREWPDPRFSDNGDETITDNLTGIIWTKNTDFPYSEVCSPGTTDFPSSVDYIKCLNDNIYLGYSDWRLPNEFEVRSRMNYNIPSSEKSNWLAGYGFYNFSSPWVQSWSSTIEVSLGFPDGVWVGGGFWDSSFQFGHVWPVRGGANH